MAFPNVNPLIETFLEPTRIFLFGKRFSSLVYRAAPMSEGAGEAGASLPPGELSGFSAPPAEGGAAVELPMPPGPVERALREFGAEAEFARIYGFSFEGHYYKLPRPLLFLVRGEGHARAPEDPPAGGERQFNTRFTGVEGKDWQFASDILVWAVDKHDIAICLDLEIGRYEQVLLQWFIASEEEAANRSASASRSATSSRSAASFRSAALGPHQGR